MHIIPVFVECRSCALPIRMLSDHVTVETVIEQWCNELKTSSSI